MTNKTQNRRHLSPVFIEVEQIFNDERRKKKMNHKVEALEILINFVGSMFWMIVAGIGFSLPIIGVVHIVEVLSLYFPYFLPENFSWMVVVWAWCALATSAKLVCVS